MGKSVDFIKTMILGGIVFLLPLVLVFAVVSQGLQIMTMITEPLSKLFPIETIAGIAFVNFLAIVAIILMCFIAGFMAKSLLGKRVFESVDKKLLSVPGYALLKARLAGNIGIGVEEGTLIPVLVDLGSRSQIGFSIEGVSEERVAVFLPGAPDPWSGSIVFVSENQIKPLQADIQQTKNVFESLGRNSAELLKQK